MIISGTVTSSPVQGVTVSAPADENPQTGFVPVGSGSQWLSKPFGVGVFASVVTVTNSLSIDWSTSYGFQYWVGAANQTFLPLFVNQTPGQTIRLVTTQPAASINGQILWPAGSIFVGGTKILSSVTGGVDVWDITCISQSTFYGNRLAALA
jgi:hypothetical protein